MCGKGTYQLYIGETKMGGIEDGEAFDDQLGSQGKWRKYWTAIYMTVGRLLFFMNSLSL